ncbi:Xaa-Pro dipeptidyl-peptidase [Lacticaseibacillus hulanensis]|uniref:Xaa-Pro dipeptidyl-peptidase n=1 Tax=Lacticaseibacillus hulanensis TaxID=2493111 RepID=UPI000FDC97A9|nr:Xaa-Pro dipeptidyl-peptidase [Lacticaseibacillus hulanensis]
MHLNQFARLNPDYATKKAELSALGLPVTADDLAALAQAYYEAFEPAAFSDTAKFEALSERAASKTADLASFLETKPERIDRETFYTIGLQYLGFEAGIDFDYGSAISFMTKTGLPVVAEDIATQDELLAAFYLLLNTRTKHLVVLIDALAAKGFLREQQGDFKFFNGKTLPTFDTHKVIRERVWIESDLDTDGDGKRDMLETTIFRPGETNSGVTVPALLTANPYFRGTNDVTAVTHTPEPELAVKPARTQAKAPADQPLDLPRRTATGTATQAAAYGDEDGIYSLNDYFLARGFATVYSAGVGTRGSDGLRSTGGPDETASAVAVIEWLGGSRRAFTTRTGTTEIKAWWCNGSVAMTGKSYLGTLAIAAATSGTPALKTAISEAAISSWYDYYRENGLVVAPGGFQGEDTDVLAVDTYSRLKAAGDANKVDAKWQQRLADLAAGQDRKYGDYTPFWDARNYRNNAANIKCDIISVHGLNDWNVKPRNVIEFHKAVANLPIRHKLYLHQGQHVYLNNILSLDFTDQMNLWLSNKLLGVDNHAVDTLPDVTIQDNVEPETWIIEPDFGTGAGIGSKTIKLGAGETTFTDHSTAEFKANEDTSDGFEDKIIEPESIYADSRVVLPLAKLDHDLVLEGTPHLRLTLSIDALSAITSVRLVDLGTAKRFTKTASTVEMSGYPLGYDFKTSSILEFKPATTATNAKLITFAHANTQNPKSPAVSITTEPGQPITLELDLQPTRYHLPAGRTLALIVHGADQAQTIRPVREVTYTINLADSELTLPVREGK